jgi:hypothetical protein
MTLERDGERRESLQQLPPQRLREAARDADMPQLVAVAEAEQERARQRLLDEPAKPATTQSALSARFTFTIARFPGS